MKQAIIGLDGGGSNLRILIADKKTKKELYSKEISTGTNLSSVPNREVALDNVVNLILEGAKSISNEYRITGIGLSSAGTEIEENKRDLENALNRAVRLLTQESCVTENVLPKCFITNDIEILLNSADIAIVAGTGTVGAVKVKNPEYNDKNDVPEYIIYKLDGNGPFIGDKGSGYWIAKQVLTKVAEIENLGGYMNSKGEFIETEKSYLRDLVFKKLSEELKDDKKVSEFVSLVYSATQEKGRPFDRAKVGNLFARLADKAAYAGDETANDILDQASAEIFKNVIAAYKKGDFIDKESCDLLLSGSVLVHNDIVRYFLERRIKDKYPNVYIKVNKEKPVWSTVDYVSKRLDEENNRQSGDNDTER